MIAVSVFTDSPILALKFVVVEGVGLEFRVRMSLVPVCRLLVSVRERQHLGPYSSRRSEAAVHDVKTDAAKLCVLKGFWNGPNDVKAERLP